MCASGKSDEETVTAWPFVRIWARLEKRVLSAKTMKVPLLSSLARQRGSRQGADHTSLPPSLMKLNCILRGETAFLRGAMYKENISLSKIPPFPSMTAPSKVWKWRTVSLICPRMETKKALKNRWRLKGIWLSLRFSWYRNCIKVLNIKITCLTTSFDWNNKQ